MKKQLCALFAVALAGLAINAGIPNEVLAYDNESDVTFDLGNYEEILFVPYGKLIMGIRPVLRLIDIERR